MKNWFDRELALVSPLYFSIYNDITNKWNVRKWRHPHLQRNWKTNSDVVMAVKYRDLDARTLHDLKKGLWQARRIKYLLAEIDEANRRNDQKIDAEQTDVHRAGATDIYNHFKTNMVDMGNPNHKVKSI